MYGFRRVAAPLSLALLTGLLLSAAAAPVEADGDIESEFDMVQNTAFVNVDPGTVGAGGSGEFELDGEDLDDLEFELEVEADGLLANTLYQISISVRAGHGAPFAVPLVTVIAGSAWTNGQGELEAEGEAVIPNIFGGASAGDKWRIDQQVLRPGAGPGPAACVDCVLVCAPTTPIVLNDDGELVLFGADGDDDD